MCCVNKRIRTRPENIIAMHGLLTITTIGNTHRHYSRIEQLWPKNCSQNESGSHQCERERGKKNVKRTNERQRQFTSHVVNDVTIKMCSQLSAQHTD